MAYNVDTEEGVRNKLDTNSHKIYAEKRKQLEQSPGFLAARNAETEEIKTFFRDNNYYQLVPGKDKFVKGSYYYFIQDIGGDDISRRFKRPTKMSCQTVYADGQECGLVVPRTGDVIDFFLGRKDTETKVNLNKDEIWEKRGLFKMGKSASTDWKQPAYRNTLDVVDDAPPTSVGGKRRTKRRRQKKHRRRSTRNRRVKKTK
jgi:hypothetical protein